MAGAGYKLFATGDVLTAAQVNTYLMQQTVMVFASSAARTTALSGVIAEGMLSYLSDTNALQYYDGAAWVGVSNPGDITAVTAGTGISGGGTTGDVTITNSMATAIDAKGDLVVGTGADAFSRLAVGTNNQVLTADSSTATGLKWATPAAGGGGKILQVVQGTNSTEITSTSATFADTNLTASITPSATSSRILVMISQPYQNVVASSGNELVGNIKIQRGSTDITTQTLNFRATAYSSELQYRGTFNFHYVDSPATTSSTTYKTQYNNTGAGNFRVNNNLSTIILMEIGA